MENYRREGHACLSGRGLEIGAFNAPAELPENCRVEYCDLIDPEEAKKRFPEISAELLVAVDYLCDVDHQGLSPFADGEFDFVIFNHVIEHIANPIRMIEEIFRVTRPGGRVVISAPDRDYTFDKNRETTSFEHLLAEYQQNVTRVGDDHYLDFLRGVYPEVMKNVFSPSQLQTYLARARERREHAHVWTSASFRHFLEKSLDLLNIQADRLYEHPGELNQMEYFSVWEKKCSPPS